MKAIFTSLLFLSIGVWGNAQQHKVTVYCRANFINKNPVDYLNLPKLLPDSLKRRELIDYSKYKFNSKNYENLCLRLSLAGWKMISQYDDSYPYYYLFSKTIFLDDNAYNLFMKKLDSLDLKKQMIRFINK